MTERLRLALDAYRERTRATAAAGFLERVRSALLGDRVVELASRLGPTFVAYNGSGVSAVRTAIDKVAFEAWFTGRFGRSLSEGDPLHPMVDAARRALAGEKIEVPLDLSSCSPFEAAVLRKAAEIPSKHARSYGWIAREIGAPGAVRAVGTALGKNPVPLLVPCHRVIRGDGSAGDYVFGGEAKRTLLEAEGLDVATVEALARRGTRFIGNRESREFCLPTCGNVFADTEEHERIELRSVDDARALGLHPCRTCRPAA